MGRNTPFRATRPRTTAVALAGLTGLVTMSVAATPAVASTHAPAPRTAGSHTPAPGAHTAKSKPRSASANLLVDGDGSGASCSQSGWDEVTLPGWTITSGAPGFVCYTNDGGFPNASVPGAQPGNGYFLGGSRGNSSMSQTVDVSADAAAVDGGSATYDLSGWLGGWSYQNDRAEVDATFLDANGSPTGTANLPAVTSTDRWNTTEFLQRTATGAIPAGTRSIKVGVVYTWTAGGSTDGYVSNLSLTVSPALTPAAPTVPPSTVPGYDHVFFVMMENENESTTSNTADGGAGIIGNSGAPYLNSLAQQNTLLTEYHASTHNSDPNYLSVAGGQTFGQTAGNGNTSNCISTCTLNATSLADQVDAAGKTWKQYADGANGNCDYTSHGYYGPDDVPFGYFAKLKNDNAYCQAHWQPLTAMTTDLQSASTTPNFVWFAADDCNDMESCGIAAGDTWLRNTLPQIFNSPAWTQQRSLLIVTFDEDGNNAPGGFGPGQNNQVATIMIGSQNSVKTGFQSANRYDHYSADRTIEDALGLAPLTANDKYAAPINDAFN